MKKRWLFVIGVYSVVFISSEILTVVGHATDNHSLLNVGIFALLITLILWITSDFIRPEQSTLLSKVFSRAIQGDTIRTNMRIWLKLHTSFHLIEAIAIALFLVSLVISIAMVGPNSDVTGAYMIWFLLFSSICFPYFHMVQNAMGMGYNKIESASIYGVQAFATLAFNLLNNRDKRGVQYLMKGLNMLKGVLKTRNLSLENLEETSTTLSIVDEVETSIEYDPLLALCKSLSRQPLMLHASNALRTFINSEELAWTRRFKRHDRPKGVRITQLTVVATFIAAAGAIIQAILPETLKQDIINILSQLLGSPSVVMLVIILILAFVLFRYISLAQSTSVKWKDIDKMK